MKNFKLTLCYDGTNYHGWQRQENADTIQAQLERAIEKITKQKSAVTGCSRTDAGVHARMYVANFFSDTKIPTDKLPLALNTALPDDIRVISAETVSDDFHATFSAKEKTYVYTIKNARISDPFTSRYAYNYPGALDFRGMVRAARAILGTHDFSAFMAAGGQAKTTVRTVSKLKLKKVGDTITIKITANGFLYNMVRIIAGTLLYVGCGKLSPGEIKDIIDSHDRKRAGITLEPQGLMLYSVKY